MPGSKSVTQQPHATASGTAEVSHLQVGWLRRMPQVRSRSLKAVKAGR
jgi:hypothetical protein